MTADGSLAHPIATAGALSRVDVPVLDLSEPAETVRDRLVGNRFAAARDLPVCDPAGRVVGLVRIEDLLAAPGTAKVAEIMDPDPPTLTSEADEVVAAWHAVRHRESSLVVVDATEHLVGVVPPDRLLDVLLNAHEQDVARLGGYLASAASAEHASLESVGRRLGHRLPWLLFGLVGALAAAALMAGFEERLRANLLLVLFVPGIVYLADAVGTQTETLVIRGLSIGVRIRDVLGRELITGVLAGAIVAALFVPVGLLVWGDAAVVIAVSLALFAACATANGVAMALPALLDRLGVDPAFGSGPVATVVQDLLSIAIYLAIAAAVVG
jgi:magnesium transporter